MTHANLIKHAYAQVLASDGKRFWSIDFGPEVLKNKMLNVAQGNHTVDWTAEMVRAQSPTLGSLSTAL
ncbi:hypothetical protein [Acinetobacter sp.]|uniref:hypothetical protein n=1 Tax=Acinetobacter sp. TaxID=472 RepID=UPI00388F349D